MTELIITLAYFLITLAYFLIGFACLIVLEVKYCEKNGKSLTKDMSNAEAIIYIALWPAIALAWIVLRKD